MSQPFSLLVIDDDALDRVKVQRAFKNAGVAVHIVEAVSRIAAIEQSEHTPFNCILLDYRLPDADGIQIVQELRERGIAAPIVVLTGQGDERIAVELMKAGATDYLSKEDLSPSILVQTVRNAIRLQEAKAQTAAALRDNLEQLRFLAEASRSLAASLDTPTIVEQLAQVVVPHLATWCTIDLASPDGHMSRTLSYPTEGTAAPDPANSQRFSVAIASRGHAHGTLTLVRAADDVAYDPTDIALAEDLAQRAAVAFDNAELYTQSRDAVRIRDEFLSIASHELRTPLTSLLGYVQLLERRARREGFLNERDQRSLHVVVEQATRLNKMISALLDVSRLQSGQFSLHRLPVDLVTMVNRLAEELRPTLERHNIELRLPDQPLMVLGDEVRLHQVLQNLVHNAVKYSPHSGCITIQLTQHELWAELAVKDQGIGIPVEALPHLFHRFYRAANADEQKTSGIGLGLYVVYEIVTLHGGNVMVESEMGEGSTFSVRLPLMG